MKINCTHTELRDVAALVKHPRNPNQHPVAQINLLAKIMKHQGWRQPIVVSKRSGYIVSGHGRLEAAEVNGWTKAPVDIQDFASEADEYAHMVADNKIKELSSVDLSMVSDDFLKLEAETGLDIDLLGMLDFRVNLNDDLAKDPEDEWEGMPEFTQDNKESFRSVIVHFNTPEDIKEFFSLIGQNDTGKTKSIWFPPQEKMDTEAKRYG